MQINSKRRVTRYRVSVGFCVDCVLINMPLIKVNSMFV